MRATSGLALPCCPRPTSADLQVRPEEEEEEEEDGMEEEEEEQEQNADEYASQMDAEGRGGYELALDLARSCVLTMPSSVCMRRPQNLTTL